MAKSSIPPTLRRTCCARGAGNWAGKRAMCRLPACSTRMAVEGEDFEKGAEDPRRQRHAARRINALRFDALGFRIVKRAQRGGGRIAHAGYLDFVRTGIDIIRVHTTRMLDITERDCTAQRMAIHG